MKTEVTKDSISITCSFNELVSMDSTSCAIYGTPNQYGMACHPYISSSPQWRDDFIIATVADFCETEVWDALGWEDMEHNEAVGTDEIEITVARTRAMP